MTTEADRNDIAFLRSHLDSALDSFKQAAQERDELRAENQRLRSFQDVGMFSQLQAAEAENERLKTEREHLIEAASQIQSRLTVCQTHEAGWRERAENAEGLAWKHGNRADEAEVEIERLRAELDHVRGELAEMQAHYYGEPGTCKCADCQRGISVPRREQRYHAALRDILSIGPLEGESPWDDMDKADGFDAVQARVREALNG